MAPLTSLFVGTLLLSSQCAEAIWPRSALNRQTRQDHATKNLSYEEIKTMDFDLSLLRPQDIPDSAIINEALKAIEDLNRKQFCHRLSASMLLDNCRMHSDPNSASSAATAREAVYEQARREDYLKIFAVSLTMCDIEALHRPMPPQCDAYNQYALMGIKDRGETKSIQLNHAEMSRCLKAIGQDQSAVVSWKINQQSAAVVCQVTRMDIEKDESIALFARLTILMGDVVDEVHKLTKLNQENHLQATAAKEAVMEVRSSVEKLRNGLSDIWNGISTEAVRAQGSAKDAFSSMSNYASEFENLLNRLKKGALNNHAQQALAHQRAYDATIDLATRAQETREEMVELKNMMLQLYTNMNIMGAGLVALQDRQSKVDKQSQHVLQAMLNMTEQLQAATHIGEDHTVLLTKATVAAGVLLETIEKAESGANTWQKQIVAGGGPFGVGWLLFILTPLATVMIGSYNRKPSVIQTVGLTVLGVPLAILISMSCDLRWQDVEVLMRRHAFEEGAAEQLFDA